MAPDYDNYYDSDKHVDDHNDYYDQCNTNDPKSKI